MNGERALDPGGSSSHRKPRLLLAEDEPSLAAFLCAVLHATYEVEVATEGEQAWRSALRQPPDLLLSDVRMLGLDGIGLTRRMRADARTARVPVILLSASNEPETQRRGLAAGADAFLLKPFRPGELLACLESWLAASRRA